MKLRFIPLIFFSCGMLSCASQPREEVKSQRVVYGVIQQPSAEGGMYVLCANCRTTTPKTPTSVLKPGPISFVSPQPMQDQNERLISPSSDVHKSVEGTKSAEIALSVKTATEPEAMKIDVKPVETVKPIEIAPSASVTAEPEKIKIDVKTGIMEDEALKLNSQSKELNRESNENNTSGVNKETSNKEEKKTVVYFNGSSTRPERASVSTLDQISVEARNVGQVALRARMAKTGSLRERVVLARARAVEVRQELINRGVAAKKLRAYYHANCCWIGDPANPNNNRVEVMLEPT